MKTMTTMIRNAAAGAALLALPALAAPAAGQSWEDMSASRRVAGIESLDVEVAYGAGRLMIRPGDAGTLYRMDLRYDAEHFEPVADLSGRRLEIGTETLRGNMDLDLDGDGQMQLELSTGVEMDLELAFGAVRADLDLGGLTLSGLELETGASQSVVDFSEPTRGRIRTAQFTVGAADFEATNLGNLRADRITLEAGVGDITLDFGGEWAQDLDVDIEIGLGALELRIPENVGVRIEKDSFLTRIDAGWLDRDGDVYTSDNWDSADRRITIDVEAAFGRIKVVRIR